MAQAPARVITETKPHFGYIKGECKWAKILEADDYGKFSINMYLSPEDFAEHVEKFEALVEEARAEVEEKGKKINGVADVYKTDNEGKDFFGFSLKDEVNSKGVQNKIDVYDNFGKKVEDWDKLIGNGSTVKIKYMANPYYMASTKMVGLSYRFYAIQVIDLVEYGGGESGFGDESGGSSSSDIPFDTDDNADF